MADFYRHDAETMKMNSQMSGSCIPQETVIKDVRLAMAYVPFHKMCTLLPPMEALLKGTAFPELFSPYEGKDKKYKPPVKCR
ncbi:MAG: spore coat associated protein CotJA [Bacillota bacterium]|nr:spore coat associated protein CotJA [Bacillota bacterium]